MGADLAGVTDRFLDGHRTEGSFMSVLTMNLYLVRHGETEANVNHQLHRTKSDHAIRLTKRGKQQAAETGEFLAEHLGSTHTV